MILHFLLSISFATTLVIKAPTANPNDFFVYAQNNEVEKISSHFLKCEKISAVQQTLKEAQYNFLSGSMEKSRELFKQLADQKWDCDWKEEERKIIAFSFYRLAQISQNEMEQIQYLTDAINFDETSTPDDAIFPPPTVILYKKLKNQIPKKTYSLPTFAKSFSYILRNGQFINLSNPALEVYGLRARYTFVSDSYKIESFTLTAEELLNREVEPKALVAGDCGNPQLSSDLAASLNGELENTKIFFDKDCLANGTQKTATAITTTLAAHPQFDAGEPIPSGIAVSQKKSWLQRNYLWVGAVVVSSFLIASQIHNNNESQQTVVVPTSTYSGVVNAAPSGAAQ